MTVHLVGVGPGSADLMTVRAARLLGRATAVVYDRLVGDDVLDFVSPTAERYPVGKTPGRPGPTQDDINELLIQLGRRHDSVVRVKGGDPFVFGRGIEEARAVMAAGLAVEVVPGVTSALAAPMTAGISVTGRGVSSGACIVTAHQDPDSTPIDWDAVARSGLTISVLMGARRAAEVRDQLLAGGLAPTTPVAVITDAHRAGQRSWSGTLERLGSHPVAAPSVLVIGDAAHPAHRPRPPSAPKSTHSMTSRGVKDFR